MTCNYLDFYSLKTLCDVIGMTGFKSLKITEVKAFKLEQEYLTTTLYYRPTKVYLALRRIRREIY